MIENLIGHHWIAFISPFDISLFYQYFGLKDLMLHTYINNKMGVGKEGVAEAL